MRARQFKFARAAALAGVAVLAGCGGSGDGSNSAEPVIIVTPPPPTPSPPPSPAYRSARDFSNDRSDSDFGVRIETFEEYGSAAAPPRTLSLELTTTLGDAGFVYQANPKAYRAFYGREVADFTRIAPIEVSSLSGDQDYDPSDRSPSKSFFRLVRGSPGNFASLDYVGFASWRDLDADFLLDGKRGIKRIDRTHLYGAKTVPTDLPTTGSASYNLGDVSFFRGVVITIDWTTGAMTGTGRVTCPASEPCPNGDLGELVFRGQFDRSSRFMGTLSGSAGYGGNFVGSFYGPRAVEVGTVAQLSHATRPADDFVGTAKRQ